MTGQGAANPGAGVPLLRGVIAAAVTPCRDSSDEIDLGAVYDLADFLAGHKVNAMVWLGSTGEFPHFDFEARSLLIERVVQRSRVPVIANVSHSSLRGALALAERASMAGAAALLLMPPYFFRYGQQDLAEFFLRFAGALRKPPPLLLYNIPKFTNPLETSTALQLLEHGGYSGIKDSSGDWPYFERLLASGLDRTYLAGVDALYVRGRAHGAHGVVSGVAAAVPELMVALEAAIAAGDAAGVARLQTRLDEFLHAIAVLPAPVAIKQAVALRGIHTGPPSNPLGAEGRALLDTFIGWFCDWLPAVARECKGGA